MPSASAANPVGYKRFSFLQAQATMVVYIFGFAGYVKLGVARRCPYERLQLGFWHDRHPAELCNRLDDCVLLHLFAGGLADEQALHSAFGSDCGEFYKSERLPEMLSLMRCMLEELPLPPPRPTVSAPLHVKGRCCRAAAGLPADSACNRADHNARSLATKGQTRPCPRCGKEVSVRSDKLKQHQRGSNCK